MGIAGYKNSDKDFSSLLKRADEALYRAKKQGRNKIVIDNNEAEGN